MFSVRRPDNAQSVNQGARHTLFVEGKFDAEVLRAFFDAHPLEVELRVEPFGPSFSSRSAAEALHRHHPEYYFLIDRDHCDDAEVERSWQRFPDPATSNILIWRRRELENYFLIPEYLLRSPHLRAEFDEASLRTCIREACQRRVFLDAANHVITGLREGFKRKWVELFDEKPDLVPSREAALKRLCALDQLVRRRDEFSAEVAPTALGERLDVVLQEFGVADERLSEGQGCWRERVRGKMVLTEVIQRCFQVRAGDGRFLQGEERQREVGRALAKRPLAEQPDDFQSLHELLRRCLRAS